MARRDEEDEYEDDEYDEDEYEEYEEYEEEVASSSWINRFSSASWRRAVMVPLVLILFGFGTWFIWKKYKNEVLGNRAYALDPNAIQFTPPPEWIKTDILEWVVKYGSLDGIKSHEPGLAPRVANAFQHHPWVKRVERVKPITNPANLVVDISYREPVAMVVVPDDDPTDEHAFIQPIDAEAVWLPPEDFTPQFAQAFPRIDVGNTNPSGPPGTGWGDDAVSDAAKIAEVLFAEWETLKEVIYQIELSSQPFSMSNHADFDIRGRPDLGPDPPGLVIRWGRAPGKEHPQEPTAKAKIQKLKQWVEEARANGRLPIGEIDLRSLRALQASKLKTMR